MRTTFWDSLDSMARGISPTLVAMLLIVPCLIPFGSHALSTVFPLLPLIAIYYWIVHQPMLMPAWCVFAVGLLQDLAFGSALGAAAVAYLTVYWMVASQRRVLASASFAMVWCMFALTAAFAFGILWLLNGLVLGFAGPLKPLLLQYVLTLAAYPLFAWLAVQVERVFRR